ncbi:hypothetical protein [Streptomyces sp. 7N604]|uniref:hypothetical protein n=1 Tax=Streptomyces sp. 7N604 TaxID=3457415 RepID=UPI003FD27884
MTPAPALPGAALRVLRMAARWRGLRVAVFLGALVTLGFAFAEHAEAVEVPTPPTASQLPGSPLSPVVGIGQPSPKEFAGGSADSVLRSATSASESEGRSAVAEPGAGASATAATATHGVEHARPAVKPLTGAVQAAVDAVPRADEGAGAAAGTGQSVIGMTGDVGRPWFGLVEDLFGALPPVAAPDLMPPHQSDGSVPDAADCRTQNRPSVHRTALQGLNFQQPLRTENHSPFRPMSLPGPPGEHSHGRSLGIPAEDGPLRSPTDPPDIPGWKTTAEGTGDQHAHAILHSTSCGFPPGASGLLATTAPLCDGCRDIIEFPG